MYVIHIGQRAENRTTLAGVLEYLNDDRDGRAVPRAEDIAVRHVERGAIPVVRLASGNFAVRPSGTRRAILSMLLDEVDRFIVRASGKVLRPHEMSRAAWGAVVAAGRLAYFPAEAIDMSQDDAGPLFQTADLFEETGAFDIAEFVCGEFVRRFGYPIKPFPEQKVLYRSDNLKPLSTVSKKYQVVQPSEILEFYRDLTEVGGYQLETAGVLKEGRKLWALARTGQSTKLAGDDEVRGYLLLATACDGTLATTAQFTSVRVVCNNTLQIALGRNRGAVKVPHRSQFDPRAVKEELGIAISSWDGFMVRMHELADRRVSQAESERFFQRLFTYSWAKPESDSPDKVNERGLKAVLNLFEGNGRGATLASAAGTAWGLVNSVTEYVDHQQRARNPGNRLDSAWFGAGAVLKQRAWDSALELIE